jgi:hypothetical protein
MATAGHKSVVVGTASLKVIQTSYRACLEQHIHLKAMLWWDAELSREILSGKTTTGPVSVNRACYSSGSLRALLTVR